MSKQPTLLQQFRSFYFQNSPKSMEDAIEYFAIFGGMSWPLNMSLSILEIIEEKIFTNYKYIHADITKITHSDKTKHSILSALALGDSREHSAFKRARISKDEGEEAIDALVEDGLLHVDKPQAKALNNEEVSNKLRFNKPFMRFWFTFISPFYKGIRDGNYNEVIQRFENREQGFSDLIFTQLAMEVIKKGFVEHDPIVKIGSYWDRENSIDILAKTASGKIIAATCKTSKAKAKKSELTKLRETCANVELTPDICIIVSKNGFTKELKVQKSASVQFVTLKNFKVLVEDLAHKDLIPCDGKVY